MRKKKDECRNVNVSLICENGRWIIESDEDVFPKEAVEFMLNNVALNVLDTVIKMQQKTLTSWKIVTSVLAVLCISLAVMLFK